MIGLALLLATGCGPMQLAGNWSVTAFNNDCRGVLALRQDDEDLTGSFACLDRNGWNPQGQVTGSLRGDSVSLQWSEPGYLPVLVAATARDEQRMSGVVNGSGFVNAPFNATR